MAIQNCHQWQLRPALSVILLLVNSRLSLDEPARMIDSPVDGDAVSRVLQLLEKQDQWDIIRAALIRMADYLADHGVPVDYQRRRRADYSTLLPDTVWTQICRDTATPGPSPVRARIARCFLFERLSGQPTRTSPWGLNDSALRNKTADFPRHLTPELAQALNEHAREFLTEQGIDEPLVWHPPKGVLDGRDLPGPDPATVDIADLHRVMTVDGIKLGTAAQRLNTSLDTVRYLLEAHPAPRPATVSRVVLHVDGRVLDSSPDGRRRSVAEAVAVGASRVVLSRGVRHTVKLHGSMHPCNCARSSAQ